MVKLNIINMNEFLKVVNGCTGAVTMICHDGKKVDINKAYGVQRNLQEDYKKNRGRLKLCLDIRTPRDYIDIICYYAGEC